MALISDDDRKALSEMFDDQLDEQVTLVLFTFDEDSPEYAKCQFCDEFAELVEEVSGLSDHIDMVVYDFEEDKDVVEKYNILRAPALAVVGEKDFGIRYYGIPSGYEGQSLIEDIVDVSNGDAGLSDETMKWAAGLDQPVHLQVFVTPT